MTDPDTEKRRITDYGASDSPPTLYADEAVMMRQPTRTLVGWRGPVPSRKAYGFLLDRNYRTDVGPEEYGFVVEQRVLKRLRGLGCTLVLIAEDDTNMVFEYHEKQFDDPTPKTYTPFRGKQGYHVTVEENRGQWPDHMPDVLINDDE